ncbi:MAG: hypothetical protein NC390_04335 [Fusobacterium sp.]|nr:hypothetical protein [Fusobacterium sp.]
MVEKAQFNPFAYQTAPLKQVQFRGPEVGTPVAQPQEQKTFGYVTRPAKQPSDKELLTEAYDKNFVKDTFAYAGAKGPSTSMPESRAYYDDSDFRGKMYYAA